MKQYSRRSTTKGFSRASGLMQARIKGASEKRGFAVTRLLTHWADIVGETTASVATPIKVSYGRQGLGATLSILTTGAQAPMLEMQKEQIREKVNACYGYRAISKVRITQTAPTGFAEGQVAFAPAAPKAAPAPDPATTQAAQTIAHGVADDGLRIAIERLATNVITKSNRQS